MKAVLSAEYYESHKERFLEWVPGNDYINLDAELGKAMKPFESIGLEDYTIEVIRKMEAQKIAEKCLKLVTKEMQTVKGIEAGTVSFGYSTSRQEIEARSDFRKRFEFNCWQLADFRKRHGL